MSSNNFRQGRLIKIEWLVTDVTAVGFPGRAKCAIFGVILARHFFGQFRTHLWSLSIFVMLEPPLEL